MVRRRSTVRFRKGAPACYDFSNLESSIWPTASGSLSAMTAPLSADCLAALAYLGTVGTSDRALLRPEAVRSASRAANGCKVPGKRDTGWRGPAGRSAAQRSSAPSISPATRSPIITAVAAGPRRIEGTMERSATRRPSTPWTRQYWSTTAAGSVAGPM